jgi:hypothetical protein
MTRLNRLIIIGVLACCWLLGQGLAAAEELDVAPLPPGVPAPNTEPLRPIAFDVTEAALATEPVVSEAVVPAAAPAARCCCPTFVAGAEAVWLSPHQNTRVTEFQVLEVGGPVLEQISAGIAENNDLYITPRIWLGVQGETLGLMLRYWRIQEPDNKALTLQPDLTGFFAENTFKAETLDLEVTCPLCLGCHQLLLSGGVRYAQLRQSSLLSVYDTAGNDVFEGFMRSQHNFSGTGFTGAITGLRPLGSGGHWSLFYGIRGSLLWADAATNNVEARAAQMSADDPDNPAWDVVPMADGSRAPAYMTITEFQLGVQWNQPLQCLPANAFLRLAVEYQCWKDFHTGAGAVSREADNGVLASRCIVSSGEANVDMVGFTIGTGITW